MNRQWIAIGFLTLSLLCSCRSSGAPEQSAAAAAGIPEVSADELKNWMATGRPFTLIDVRESDEWQAGHAAAALHISRWTLADRIGAVVPDRTAPIVLYCGTGRRSVVSAGTLRRLGYSNVFSLAGGLKEYEQAGLPIQR